MNHIHSISEEFQEKRQEWRHVLEILLQGNIFLKMRLADVLSNNHLNGRFLEIAEQYQNRFVGKDEIIGFIRKDIAEMENHPLTDKAGNENLQSEIILKQNRLQKEIVILKTSFNELEVEFNKYLAEIPK